MSNENSVLSGDPRTQNIDDQFRVLISGIGRAFGTTAHVKGLRATHSYGTTARGILTVLDSPSIPTHTVFSAGKHYPVLVRHANIKGFPDDAILDGRGATVRILSGCPDAKTEDIDLDDYIVDILMSTGRSFKIGRAHV